MENKNKYNLRSVKVTNITTYYRQLDTPSYHTAHTAQIQGDNH